MATQRYLPQPDFSQYILPIAIVIGGYIVINKIFDSNESGTNQSQESQEETVDEIKKEIVKENLTLPASWYSQTADFLQENLVLTWKNWEPARECLNKILTLKNADDWKKLVSVFGVRKPRAITNTYAGGNLASWLRYFTDQVYYRDKNGEKWKELKYIDVINTKLKSIKVNPI